MTHYGSFVRVKNKAREWDADDTESASLVEAVKISGLLACSWVSSTNDDS